MSENNIESAWFPPAYPEHAIVPNGTLAGQHRLCCSCYERLFDGDDVTAVENEFLIEVAPGVEAEILTFCEDCQRFHPMCYPVVAHHKCAVVAERADKAMLN